MDTILDYLDEIDDILESSKPVPFSNNRVSVDKLRLIEILEDIRLNMPREVEKAQHIVVDHDRIIEDAKRKASLIIEDARHEIVKLADEHEIATLAEQRAREIIDIARHDARDIRQNAMAYADGLLEKIEDTIRDSLNVMDQTNRSIDELFRTNLDIIHENRAELQENLKK